MLRTILNENQKIITKLITDMIIQKIIFEIMTLTVITCSYLGKTEKEMNSFGS